MRGTDKLNICETFYIYVGQWRTGRSRVCVTLQSSRNDKKSSIGSRSILVQFSIGSRSAFVRPSFCLRSSFVHPSLDNRRSIEEQSKIYRKNNENAMEPQGYNLRAATNMHRYMNEQASNGELCAVRNVELCAMRNVECGMLSVEWLPLAMLSGCLWQCWMLSVELFSAEAYDDELFSFELWVENS